VSDGCNGGGLLLAGARDHGEMKSLQHRLSGNYVSLVDMRSGRLVRNALLIQVLVQTKLTLEAGSEKGCLQHGVRQRNLAESTKPGVSGELLA